jgi:hypothetical protein
VRAVADPLSDIDDLIEGHGGEVTLRVTDLLSLFGRFNLNDRDMLATALAEHGVAVDPPLAEVERSSVVRLRHADVAVRGHEAQITRWHLHPDGSATAYTGGTIDAGVLWVDVEAEGIEPYPLDEILAATLAAAGETLDEQAAARLEAELRSHDHRPSTHRYGTRVGSVSSFAVAHDEDTPEDPTDPLAPKTGRLTFWPLELAAGERFLVTVRRAGERISARTRAHARDDAGQVQRCPVLAAHELEAEVHRRWRRASVEQDGDRTGGDAGLLLMHWIADGVMAALLEIEAWLRQWELHVLEHAGQPEDVTLITLRDMLSELEARTAFFSHPHADDPVSGWLPAVTEAAEAHQVHALFRRSVRAAERLELRVRDRLTTVATRGDESRGRRIETVGFVLLFPALILGVFSANTNTPGAGTWVGFAAMIAVMLALTYAAYRLLRR